MKNSRSRKKISPDEIADMADRGEDVTKFFKGTGKMVPGYKTIERLRRVNVDFTESMLKELDAAAEHLNISRQAVIKTLLRQALNLGLLSKKSS